VLGQPPTLYDAYNRPLIGGPDAYVRRPGGELQPTVFPLPVRPLSDLTPQMRRAAIEATYTGRLQEAVDLYRQCVTEDGYISGILATMAHGILGMPHTFQGDAAMCEALDDAGGTPSEYRRMHPENECAQIFADGLGFIGLGQYVYDASEECQRPAGTNRVPHLEWRDPRWLWRNPITLQWYFTSRAGMRAINPGDGEWFMFCPYPNVDAWRHGPWLYITLAAIFARDAAFDRQRVSEVTTPTPVMRATKPTSKDARKEALRQLKDLAHDHRIVLPEQWEYEIVSTSGEYKDVAQGIIDWATGMVEVGLTGNMMGMKAQSAFTDANVYKRTTTDRRRFFANAWCDAVRAQGLRYWGRDNYANDNAPVVKINVESPEDRLSESKAIEQEGKALVSLQQGCDAVGVELDPEWVVERAQAKGIRVRPKLVAVPAPPTPAMPSAPAATPAPNPAPSAPTSEDDAPQEPGDAARLAEKMTAHGIARCEHGALNRCRLCGVERVRDFEPGGDGQPQWRIAWRPIGQAVAA